MKLLTPLLKSLLIALISLPPLFATSAAKESDFTQNIVVDAKKQSMDIKNHIVTFTGNVIVNQGTLTISADELKMYTKDATKDGDEVIVAKGNPAKYSQQLENGQIIKAQANEIFYDLKSKTLKLSGESELNQNDSSVRGDVINYNLIKQELIAEGGNNNKGIVTTIFKPEAKEPSTEKK